MKREPIEKLEFRNLKFSYEDGREVFTGLDFDFSAEPILYLQGPTGGGKTTLMKILVGLASPTSGDYLINGQEVGGLSFSEFDAYRLNMGYAFDVGGLINNQSLYENFKLPLDFHGFMEEQHKRDYIIGRLELFHLGEQKHIRPAFVSTGARKAASLLKALLLDPAVAILNDPTLGLNSELIEPFIALIREHQIKRGLKHVIIASEDMNLMHHLPGRIVQVTNKRLRYV
jgi:phospholipid/cholesterol/gamma-HCH transport system ATP-binding protein